MSEAPVITERLDSWKQIASYVGRDVRTVIRWEQRRGLPVHRVPGGGRQVVFAYPHEIDEWLASGHAKSNGAADQALHDQELAGRTLQSQPLVIVEAAPPGISDIATAPSSRSQSMKVWIASAGIAGALAVVAFLAVLWLASPRKFLEAGEEQITNDGLPKEGLVSGGANLYFGEWRDGRQVLSTVPAQGGEIRQIPTPFVQAEPVAVSRDGQRLLVLAGEGMEREHPLWVVPVNGGQPQRVGNFLCHSAAWSPDEREIAYSSGNAIYVMTGNGVSQLPIQTFAGVPDHLHWSLDGKRIIFLLRDMTNWNATPWELALSNADHSAVTSLAPLTRTHVSYSSMSPVLDTEDEAFVNFGNSTTTIQVLEKLSWPRQPGFMLANFVQQLGGNSELAVDAGTQRLFMLREADRQSELDWFDKRSNEFRPFLPGIAARDVDFSRDGRSIVFVQFMKHELWVADRDGGSAKQISTPGLADVELPRWSPDGKQIAFMGKRIDAPWRIYVVQATGGNLHEASAGTDGQGAPTWSPDGRRLVYGRVDCQEEKTCAIGEIDLSTSLQTVVEGSDGLSTARWSPDGRYIAALRAEKFQVFLLDRRTGAWRKLADGVNGNDLAWAPDSKAVYAIKPGGERPEVIRISLRDARAEPAVDLTSFSKFLGRIDTWFTVTPDDSILLVHNVSGNEIFALHYIVR